jgi:predicted amidohydrolase YtcJ
MSHDHLSCACCVLSHLPTLTSSTLTGEARQAELNAAFQQVYPQQSLKQAPQALIFHNGIIHTMAADGDFQVAALGTANGTIVAVGTLEEVRHSMQAHQPDEIDLNGRTLLPGFIDPHMHVLSSAMYRSKNWLSLTPFKSEPLQQELDPEYSFDSISQKISHALKYEDLLPKDSTGQSWVLGFGVDPSMMRSWIDINAEKLDKLDVMGRKIPILLVNSSGHIAYLNTAGIELAKIKSADGVLTEGDITAALAFAPQTTQPELIAGVKQVLDNATAMGNTTLFDAGLGMGESPDDEVKLLKAAAIAGPVRIAAALYTKPDEGKLDHWLDHYKPDLGGPDNKRFSLKAIKLIADGSNQGLTGYQNENYACCDKHKVPDVPADGLSNYPDTAMFTRMLDRAVTKGWQILVHANGDKAMDYVLASYKAILTVCDGLTAEQVHQRQLLRLRVEHASLLNDVAIGTLVELKLNPSFLIGHVGYWGYSFQKTILGKDRADLLDRCHSVRKEGVRISLHTDHFVSPLGALRVMEQAVFRTMEAAPTIPASEDEDVVPDKNVLNKGECLSRIAALRAITIDAAWHCHMDHLVGSLEPGKQADLVILAQNPLDESVRKLRDIVVEETWLAGVKVHSNTAG